MPRRPFEIFAELCRKEGINQNLYYRWSKEFLEVGKKRPAGDTAREANSDEVKSLRREAAPDELHLARADYLLLLILVVLASVGVYDLSQRALGDVEKALYWSAHAGENKLPWALGLFSYCTAPRSLHEDPSIRAEAARYPTPLVPYPKE